MANTIEKIMKDFLCSGVSYMNRDHLVSWEVCYGPKKERGLGHGNLVSKNISLAIKWLWCFPLEPHSLWHQVIQSKYDLDRNKGECEYCYTSYSF